MGFLDNANNQPSMKRYMAGGLLCAVLAIHALLANKPELLLELAKLDIWLIAGLAGFSLGEYYSNKT